MEFLRNQNQIQRRHNDSSEPSSSTLTLETERSSEELDSKNITCKSSKFELKMKIEGNKTSPCFVNQYTRVVSQNSGTEGTEMIIEETSQKGIIKNNACKIIKKCRNLLGIKKNSKSLFCKKMKTCLDMKKNLKRVSCYTEMRNKDGSCWTKQTNKINNINLGNSNFGKSKRKPKIKKKIVYKDEDGNVIDPNLVENGDYIRKDQSEKEDYNKKY